MKVNDREVNVQPCKHLFVTAMRNIDFLMILIAVGGSRLCANQDARRALKAMDNQSRRPGRPRTMAASWAVWRVDWNSVCRCPQLCRCQLSWIQLRSATNVAYLVRSATVHMQAKPVRTQSQAEKIRAAVCCGIFWMRHDALARDRRTSRSDSGRA